MLEELKKYLSETPTKQIAEEWEEMTKDAACNAPTIGELFNTWNRVYKNDSIDSVSTSEQVCKTNAIEWIMDVECGGKLYNAVKHLIKKEYVEDITTKDILQLRGYGQSVLAEFEQLKRLTLKTH